MLLRQRLLEIRGFLNYVVRTYPWMNPYLKGLHLTIDGWREDRNSGGWKVKEPGVFQGRWALDEEFEGGSRRTGHAPEEGEPDRVAPRPRLLRDIRCLLELTGPSSPPPLEFLGVGPDDGSLHARRC